MPARQGPGDLLLVEPEHVSWSRERQHAGVSLPESFTYTSDRNDLLLADRDVDHLLRGMMGGPVLAPENVV